MAAQAIFAQDENQANSIAVKEDPKPFGYAIINFVRISWRPKYQKINNAIGRTAARIPYADFDTNSDAKKIADAEMIKFPQWARLHNFWRLLPDFNQFADKLEGESSPSRTNERKRKKARDVEDSDELEYSDDAYSSPKPVLRARARVEIGPPGRRAKRIIKRSSTTVSKPSHLVKAENDATIIIDLEDDEPESFRASTSTAIASLTRDQKFEKEMAELRLRTKEQECRAKEQEYKVLEEKHKHEAFMALYGPRKL